MQRSLFVDVKINFSGCCGVRMCNDISWLHYLRILCLEDGIIRLLGNVGFYPTDCTASYPLSPSVKNSKHRNPRVLKDSVLRTILLFLVYTECKGKGKGLPQEAEVAQGVPCRLRPRIFLTFGTTRVVGRQPQHRPPLPQEKSLVLIFRG